MERKSVQDMFDFPKNPILGSKWIREIEDATRSFYFPTARTRVVRYALAVFYTVLAFIIKDNSGYVLGTGTPFLLFFGAITLSALQGGFGPGSLATGLSAILVSAFFQPPGAQVPSGQQVWQVVVFLFEGGLISVLSESRIRSEMERARLLLFEHETKKLLEAEIRQRKKVESDLLNSRNELAVILREVDDGITVQDPYGKISFANQAAAHLTGFSSVEEFMTTPPAKILEKYEIYDEKGDLFPFTKLPGRRAVVEGIASKSIVNFKFKESGEERWSVVSATPVFDEHGKVRFAINVFHDITEQKSLDKRKDEFMGLVSHELRTPLTSLLGFIELLEKHWIDKKDEKTNRYLGYIHEEVTRLSGMVMDFLDVTRVRVGKLVINKTHFRVSDFLAETLEGLQFLSNTHRIVFKGSVKSYIFADRARLAQVLTNFLTNAIKYSPNANKVVLSATRKGEMVIIGVKDFGIGIEEADQKHIFTLFYQSDDPARPSRGLGIGLYIAAQIVQAHGGKIWLKSKKGKGSTFYFSVPVGA